MRKSARKIPYLFNRRQELDRKNTTMDDSAIDGDFIGGDVQVAD